MEAPIEIGTRTQERPMRAARDSRPNVAAQPKIVARRSGHARTQLHRPHSRAKEIRTQFRLNRWRRR
jgi:hypothetical protein